MKNYQTQTPQILALTKRLLKSRKTSTSLVIMVALIILLIQILLLVFKVLKFGCICNGCERPARDLGVPGEITGLVLVNDSDDTSCWME